jgi:hypothetical protein
MTDQPNAEQEPKQNPSGAPPVEVGDEIIVHGSKDAKKDQWNVAHVVAVRDAGEGTCDAMVSMQGGFRKRIALHYIGDPRLASHPLWLPPHEPDSGVWDLSPRERRLRQNAETLARVEEVQVELTAQVRETIKETQRAVAELQNWVQEQVADEQATMKSVLETVNSNLDKAVEASKQSMASTDELVKRVDAIQSRSKQQSAKPKPAGAK